jgi:hypothetical protein
MDLKAMLGIRKKPIQQQKVETVTHEVKEEVKEVERMGEIYKRGIVYLDENGETSKLPKDAFAVTEHIITNKVFDNGIEQERVVAIFYSYLIPVAEEPEPKEEEERRPVAVARRK